MTLESRPIVASLRYITRLGGALLRSAGIVLGAFGDFYWAALAISWFGGVLLALAYLHEGAFGWLGRSTCVAVLLVASVISYSTAQRWIKIAPAVFGASVFAGLVNYSGSEVTVVEAATLLAAMVLCAVLSSNLADCPLTKPDRIALTAGLLVYFNGLLDRDRMFAWMVATVALFAMPWIAQRLRTERKGHEVHP